MKYRSLILIFFVVISNVSCQGNFFKEMAGKDTVEALYEDALKLTDQGDFSSAFAKIEEIEVKYSDFAATDKFKKTKAGILAGQCGLTFITFVDGISNASGSKIFEILMQAFRGLSVNPQKCADAQVAIESMSAVDSEQLLFMAVLGMSKIGTYLKDRADRDGTSSLGDGSADAGFDACDSTAAANRLTDSDLKQVITGLGLTLQNFALIGGEFSGSSASSSIEQFQAFCDDPAGNGSIPAIDCQVTDPNSASLTPQLLRTFRRVLKTSSMGIGTATPGCNLTFGDPAYCCPGLATP